GSPRRSTALTRVNTALLAPIPSDSAASAASVTQRSLINLRAAKRRSCRMLMSDRRHFRGPRDDAPVEQMNVALRVARIPRIVRHHTDRGAGPVQFVKEIHHRLAAFRIQVAG